LENEIVETMSKELGKTTNITKTFKVRKTRGGPPRLLSGEFWEFEETRC
jgi:hypothetical protein